VGSCEIPRREGAIIVKSVESSKEKAIVTKDTKEMPLTHGSERRMRSPRPARRPAPPFYVNTSIEILVSILNGTVSTS
jgi:hypothetical protein